MKRPRLPVPSRCWTPLAVLLVPPLLWTLLIAVLPTGWARSRVVSRLEAVSGRPVTLGALRVGFCGGVTLSDLTVAAPGNPSNPWLKADHAQVDLSLGQLLFGRIDPSLVTLDGLRLRLHRRADATWEFADSRPLAANLEAHAAADATEPPALQFQLAKGVISLLDEPTGTRLEMTDLEGHGVWEGKRTTLESLRGVLNGGRVELAAQLDRSGAKPAFEARLRTEKVQLDKGLRLLSYIAPIGAGDASGLQGNLDLNLYVRGIGTGRDDLRHALVGQGTVALAPVLLDDSPLLADLAAVLNCSETGGVGGVNSSFAIKGGRITTDDLTVDLAKMPLLLSGWTDFNGRVDYRLKVERLLSGRLSGRAQELFAENTSDAKSEGILAIQGDCEHLSLTLDGKALGAELGTREGRERWLRDLARKTRERLLR